MLLLLQSWALYWAFGNNRGKKLEEKRVEKLGGESP